MNKQAGIRRGDFTLIELLVVVAVIAILASMLLPALSQARQTAKNARCVSAIRQGSIVFSSYFADWSDSMPPLSAAGYNYGGWYRAIIPYASVKGGGESTGDFRKDQPPELMCPADVVGVYTYGYRHWLYATNWRLRFKGASNGLTPAYRVTEMMDPSTTGLLMDNSYYADCIYYMRIEDTLGGRMIGTQWYASPQHEGSGFGVSYMDGHAEFEKVTYEHVLAGYYRPDVEFFHRSFWGRTAATTYISGYYRYQP